MTSQYYFNLFLPSVAPAFVSLQDAENDSKEVKVFFIGNQFIRNLIVGPSKINFKNTKETSVLIRNYFLYYFCNFQNPANSFTYKLVSS